MARNGSGTYSLLTNSWNPAVNGTPATAADWQSLINDVASAITQSISKDGQTPYTGNQPMGGNKLTGLSAGNAAGDSLRFEQLFSQGTPSDIASASTVDIGAQLTNFLNVTGTTTITSFGTNYNGPRFLRFAGALTLTHNASTLILPGGANITTAAGDSLIVVPKGSPADGWAVISFQRASSNSVIAGSLTVNGNTTLGDSSTDTVTVNGYMALRGTPASYYGLSLGTSGTISGDANPRGISSSATYASDATAKASALFGQIRTTAASFTMADAIGVRLGDASKGAGSTITNLHGVYVDDLTQGTNNFGITSLVSSGTNKWNIYASGTASNYFAGDMTFAGGINFYKSVGTSYFGISGGSAPNSGANILMYGATAATPNITVFRNGGTETCRIDSAGNLLITSGTGALGYGTGAGGTVTQATSRTTGVTLNKPCGSITMFSAAGSTTAASFTVTNSLVAATDTIVLSVRSATNKYRVDVTTVSAGSFEITFASTGGTATDAPVINFTVIKGATS